MLPQFKNPEFTYLEPIHSNMFEIDLIHSEIKTEQFSEAISSYKLYKSKLEIILNLNEKLFHLNLIEDYFSGLDKINISLHNKMGEKFKNIELSGIEINDYMIEQSYISYKLIELKVFLTFSSRLEINK